MSDFRVLERATRRPRGRPGRIRARDRSQQSDCCVHLFPSGLSSPRGLQVGVTLSPTCGRNALDQTPRRRGRGRRCRQRHRLRPSRGCARRPRPGAVNSKPQTPHVGAITAATARHRFAASPTPRAGCCHAHRLHPFGYTCNRRRTHRRLATNPCMSTPPMARRRRSSDRNLLKTIASTRPGSRHPGDTDPGACASNPGRAPPCLIVSLVGAAGFS